MVDTSQRQQVWTRFWQSGALHSCAGSFDGSLGPSARDFWLQAFADLSANSQVADLACGNGSLARLLADTRQPLNVDCIGIDIAELRPDWLQGLPTNVLARLHFRGRTRLEKLPLADVSLDLVCSQYGLEYANREAACAEIRRVLRPDGRLALLMHHCASLPVRLAHTELRHGDRLLAADGLFAAAQPMLDCLWRAATPSGRADLERDPAATHAREHFN
jgi:SAM-dependent methyltransferase